MAKVKFHLTEEQIAQLRKWVEVDLRTHKWVAEQLGCNNQYVSRLCRRYGIHTQRTGPRSGPGHPNWKGGRNIDRDGYVMVYCPNHPRARKPRKNYVPEHILVMEKVLGRHLNPKEVVHHINGKKTDNSPENLQLFASNAEHLRHELTGRTPNWSEEGKARIQAGIEKAAAINRQRSKTCDSLNK